MQPRMQKALRKDIFTPLKLETMFNPPSPQETRVPTPEQSLNLSGFKKVDVTPERGVPFLFNGRDSSKAFPFTFSVQRSPCPNSVQHNCTDAQVDKSRLKLFHFHYDTFTREHLSALVDAIPVSSSSFNTSSALIHDGANSSSSLSHYRPAKRIKLSPPDHLPRARRRPRLSLPGNTPASGRKDYIRESKSLMHAIAETPLFASPLVCTPPLVKRRLETEENVRVLGEDAGLMAQEKLKDANQGSYSALGFRRRTADLLPQIRRETRGNVSSVPITDEISVLSIDDNASLHSLECAAIPMPQVLVGTTSPQVRGKLVLRTERIGPGPGSTIFRTTNLALRATTGNHLSPTCAPRHHSTLPHSSQAQVSRSTRDIGQPISTSSLTTLLTETCVKHPLTVAVVSESASTTQKRPENSTANSNANLTVHTSACGVRITQIIPTDVPEPLERVGNMVFNRQKMVWVKETDQDPNRAANTGGTSDSPFRYFESLVDGASDRLVGPKWPSEADHEVLPGSEGPTLSATQDYDDREKHNVRETFMFTDHNVDGGSEPNVGVAQDLPERDSSAAPPFEKDWTINLFRNMTADGRHMHSTLFSSPAKVPPPTPLRSALKPETPISSHSTPHPSVFSRTAGTVPRRSVSFSDGRTSGRIRGLHDSQTDESQSSQSSQPFPDVSVPAQVQDAPVNDPCELFEPSVRADRIAEMLEYLEGDSSGMFPHLSRVKRPRLMSDRFVSFESLAHSFHCKPDAHTDQTPQSSRIICNSFY